MTEKKSEEDIRHAGLSATRQRVALLRVLRTLKGPAGVEVLAKKLARQMNATTVYRALDQLVGAGLVRRIELGDNYARYEATSVTHHHHLVCRSCRKIEDVTICVPAGLTGRVLASATGFTSVEDHSLEFFGICTSCSRKDRQS